MEKKYTKAGINVSTLFHLFGIELGLCDSTITSWELLEKKVDNTYSKEEIIAIVKNYDI